MGEDVPVEQDAERADVPATTRKQDPAAPLSRRFLRVERRHPDQGEHANRRQRLAGGGRKVSQAVRCGTRRGADDRWRRAIQRGGGVETNADLPRSEAALQGLDELLHPSDRRHYALPSTRPGQVRRTEQERRAEASRVAGISALECRAGEPPGGPRPQDARAPLFNGLEGPR